MLSPIRPKAGEYGALVCMSAWADAGVGKDEGLQADRGDPHLLFFLVKMIACGAGWRIIHVKPVSR